MSDKKRAVQFLPFNGLRGYDEMIRKKRKIKEPKKEISERRAAFLDLMIRSMSRGDLIRCIFYKEDHYEEESGIASKVDEIKRSNTYVYASIFGLLIVAGGVWYYVKIKGEF